MEAQDPTDPCDDLPSGPVTEVIHQLGQGRIDHEELFDAVSEQLTAKARGVLRRFPAARHRAEPDELVNEFIRRLIEELAPKNVVDRRHFFALAAQHFRWILLDLLKRKSPDRLSEDCSRPADTTGPATRAERSDEHQATKATKQVRMPPMNQRLATLRAQIARDQIRRLVPGRKHETLRNQLCEHLLAA